jgi:hypothetical protein
MTRKRVGRDFFASHTVTELTVRSHDQWNTTIYSVNDR